MYEKENPIIEVGKLFPSMKEFRMCFKTYAVKHEFDAKTVHHRIGSVRQIGGLFHGKPPPKIELLGSG